MVGVLQARVSWLICCLLATADVPAQQTPRGDENVRENREQQPGAKPPPLSEPEARRLRSLSGMKRFPISIEATFVRASDGAPVQGVPFGFSFQPDTPRTAFEGGQISSESDANGVARHERWGNSGAILGEKAGAVIFLRRWEDEYPSQLATMQAEKPLELFVNGQPVDASRLVKPRGCQFLFGDEPPKEPFRLKVELDFEGKTMSGKARVVIPRMIDPPDDRPRVVPAFVIVEDKHADGITKADEQGNITLGPLSAFPKTAFFGVGRLYRRFELVPDFDVSYVLEEETVKTWFRLVVSDAGMITWPTHDMPYWERGMTFVRLRDQLITSLHGVGSRRRLVAGEHVFLPGFFQGGHEHRLVVEALVQGIDLKPLGFQTFIVPSDDEIAGEENTPDPRVVFSVAQTWDAIQRLQRLMDERARDAASQKDVPAQ